MLTALPSRHPWDAARGVASMLSAMLAALALLLVANLPAHAQSGGEAARQLVQTVTDRGIAIMEDETLSFGDMAEQFRNLVQQNVDTDRVARFALGRYWNQATPAQREEYQQLFLDYMVKVFASRMGEYAGQKIDIRGVTQDADNQWLVQSVMTSPGTGAPPLQVDWRVRRDESGTYKIVDAIVEGISLAITQRAEFTNYIASNNGQVTALLERIRAVAARPSLDTTIVPEVPAPGHSG